ncbi:hypothetical protein [Gordonia terrae]
MRRGRRLLRHKSITVIGIPILASGALILLGSAPPASGVPVPAASAEFVEIKPRPMGAVITVHPPPLSVCKGLRVSHGTLDRSVDVEWVATDELLAQDPALSTTEPFRVFRERKPAYFGPRTVNLPLRPGVHTAVAECIQYDGSGMPAGPKTLYYKRFRTST